MAKFMLLLHENPDSLKNYSAQEMQKVIEKYNAWSGKLAQSGKLLGGEKLSEEGGKRLVRKKGDVVVTDGPYSETKEVVGGYFVVEAKSYEEAVDMSRSCPHLEFGGVIDVRKVDEIPS
jgi:hypothetical protein